MYYILNSYITINKCFIILAIKISFNLSKNLDF